MTYRLGNETVLHLFFLHFGHRYRLSDGRRSNLVFSGWAGSLATACAFLAITRSVNRDTGCMVRPMILEAVLQMLRSIFLCDTDIAGKNRYYNMSTLTS